VKCQANGAARHGCGRSCVARRWMNPLFEKPGSSQLREGVMPGAPDHPLKQVAKGDASSSPAPCREPPVAKARKGVCLTRHDYAATAHGTVFLP
jgi:hypothetical protein